MEDFPRLEPSSCLEMTDQFMDVRQGTFVGAIEVAGTFAHRGEAFCRPSIVPPILIGHQFCRSSAWDGVSLRLMERMPTVVARLLLRYSATHEV
jgi:hypothetical protein